MFCSCFVVIVVLCIFIFVCISVGLLPPGESPIAVSNNNNNNNKVIIIIIIIVPAQDVNFPVSLPSFYCKDIPLLESRSGPTDLHPFDNHI
jgi:hypothetical protein